jgi:DNA primase large subunit
LQFERLVNHWSRGKINGLPKSISAEEANQRFGYWLGFCLPFILKEIYGEDTSDKRTEITTVAIEDYLDIFIENNTETRKYIIESLAMRFTYRVLGQLPEEELFQERYFYVRSFAENLLHAIDKNISKTLSAVKIVYLEPNT